MDLWISARLGNNDYGGRDYDCVFQKEQMVLAERILGSEGMEETIDQRLQKH